MGSRIISVLCAILAIGGIVFLVYGYTDYNAGQQETAKVYAELSARMSELESERRAVQEEISRLDEEIAELSASRATLNIIFKNMSEKIYTEAFPIMQEYGIKGTITMSVDELPGKEGLLTDQQIGYLVAGGWDIIPRYSEEGNAIGIQTPVDWIRQNGYDAKAMVMIDEDALTPELEETVVSAGYTTLVLDVKESGDGNVVNDKVEGIWKPRTVGYMCDDRKELLAAAVQSRGHVAFTVGFDEDSSDEYWDSKLFFSMMGYIDSLRSKGDIMCSDIYDTMIYRAEADQRRAEAETGAKAERDEYTAKLAQIERSIEELCGKYRLSGSRFK